MKAVQSQPGLVLAKVESFRQLELAWRELKRRIAEGARREVRTIGSRDGASDHRLYVRDDLAIWMAPPLETTTGYLWTPFGTLPMDPKHNQSMIVQINRVGPDSTHATAGLLATDAAGTKWICHTGRLGGGRSGISKSAFLAWSGLEPVEIVDSQGRITGAIPIARLGDDDLPRDVARYVRLVADFKARRPAPASPPRPSPSSLRKLLEEPRHTSAVAAREGYQMRRVHGQVWKCLSDAVRTVRNDAFNDRLRDLYIGKPNAPDIQFEIKPSADTQSIYTAVGQLLLHSTGAPARRRVIVLPSTLKPALRSGIEKLGIDIVTFTLTKTRIRFRGLDTLLPGTPATLPFAPTR